MDTNLRARFAWCSGASVAAQLLHATLAGMNRSDSIVGLVGGAVFGVEQLREGFVATTALVGDRVGLHPVAVIFALLVVGHLFGILGVLRASPASAGLRHLRAQYPASGFFKSR